MSDFVLDLCAGIGGWAVALRERGLHDLAVEKNPHARAALVANGCTWFHDDMTTLLEAGVIDSPLAGAVASTPCQPFSQANSNGQGVADPRGNLTLEFGRIVAALLPPFVCLENVTRSTGPVFDELVETFRAIGYVADHRVVCAADYGDAQARRRRLLVARRDEHPIAWPEPTHMDPRGQRARDRERRWLADDRLPWRTMADLLPDRDDLPDWAHKHPSTTIVGSFKPECVAPPTYRKPGDGPRQNQPGVVVTSLEERLRIQGFPEGWQTAGPKTARGLQVGNAIPPTLARVALTAALGPAQ